MRREHVRLRDDASAQEVEVGTLCRGGIDFGLSLVEACGVLTQPEIVPRSIGTGWSVTAQRRCVFALRGVLAYAAGLIV